MGYFKGIVLLMQDDALEGFLKGKKPGHVQARPGPGR
jgi:hypothetical protein